MTTFGILQIAFYLGVLVLLIKPLGAFMARVFQGERTFLDPVLRPVERVIYRVCGIKPNEEMDWKMYAFAMLAFNFLGLVAVYVIQRAQGFLPLNPAGFGAVSPDGSWNTAVSFATNTNWQDYGGETTLSYLTQMLALTVQNFVSAATGMAMLVAIVRGFTPQTRNGSDATAPHFHRTWCGLSSARRDLVPIQLNRCPKSKDIWDADERGGTWMIFFRVCPRSSASNKMNLVSACPCWEIE